MVKEMWRTEVVYVVAKRKKKYRLKIVGKTTDGKWVVQNVFQLVDSQGIPLDVVLELLGSRNYVVDWLHFMECSRMSGWKESTTKSKVESALMDIYGVDCARDIVSRL